MDAKSADDSTSPDPEAEPATSTADETAESPDAEATEPRPATPDEAAAEPDRKRVRRDAGKRPLNPEDPEPVWLSRGSGRRSLVGIGLVLVLVAGVAGLGWWLFDPATGSADAEGKQIAENCQVTEAPDEAAKVRPPTKLGTAPDRATATVTTNVGVLTVLLFGDVAPCGVSGFTYLAEQGFYGNNPCYRLTTAPADPTVTLRCGDPTGTGKGGPGFRYQAEDDFTGEVGRDYVAFINDREGRAGGNLAFLHGESKPTASLSVIGRVIAGQQVLEDIGAAAGVDPFDGEPRQPIVIQSVTIAKGTVTLPPSGGPTSGGAPTTGGTGSTSGSQAPSSDSGTGQTTSKSAGVGFPN